MRLERSDYPVIAMIAVFLVLALLLRSSVSDLAQMGTGIRQTGETLRSTSHDTAGQIRSAFGTAADAAGALPVVGSGLADSLRATGERNAAALESQGVATGNDLIVSGRSGETNAHRIANIGGLLAFLIPTTLLLAIVVPRRRDRTRRP